MSEILHPWINEGEATAARFVAGSAHRPAGASRAATYVKQSIVSAVAPSTVEAQSAAPSAFGFLPYTLGNFTFRDSSDAPAYDLALYKRRTGSGLYKSYDPPLVVYDLGIGDMALSTAGAVAPTPDAESTYGGDAPEDVCDEAGWSEVDGPYAVLHTPPAFGGATSGASPSAPSHTWWKAFSATSAGANPDYEPYDAFSVCASSTATLALSLPCTFSDLTSALASWIAAGTLPASGSGLPVSTFTGDGASDGTRYMSASAGRWRIAAASSERLFRWKEVTRRNQANVSPARTLYRESLTDLITRPYFDEFGRWAPGYYVWSDAAEKLADWTRNTEWDGIGNWTRVLVSPQDYNIYATRMRVWVDDKTTVTVRLTLSNGDTTETINLTVTGGLSGIIERTSDDVEEGGAITLVSVDVIKSGEVVTDISTRILYTQRRRLGTIGYAALDGSDTDAAPVRYQTRTRRTEWGLDATISNGDDYDDGRRFQVAVTGTAILETQSSYDLETCTEGDEVTLTTTGSFGGVPYRPSHSASTSGTLTLTATLCEVVNTLLTTNQLTEPVDANGADTSGEILESTDYSEIVPADSAGAWHTVICAVRGATKRIEQLVATYT